MGGGGLYLEPAPYVLCNVSSLLKEEVVVVGRGRGRKINGRQLPSVGASTSLPEMACCGKVGSEGGGGGGKGDGGRHEERVGRKGGVKGRVLTLMAGPQVRVGMGRGGGGIFRVCREL